MFEYFEVDISSHHTETIEENVSQRKRKGKNRQGNKSKKVKSTEYLDDNDDSTEEDIEGGSNTGNINPFYESTENSDQTDKDIRQEMEEEMEKADKNDTVPMRNYLPDNNSEDDSEDEVILNIRAREKQRKKNLERNENIQSMLREENNL